MNPRDPILKMVLDWQSQTSDEEEAKQLILIWESLRFLDRVKFNPYVPTLYSKSPAAFTERFERWLNNSGLTSAQKRDLFEFASHISFFSFDDFTTLFQNAFSGPISRWCMSQAGICLDQKAWKDRLNEELFNRTWFCPVTDSLLISVFHHVNKIVGKDRKPAFRELMYFGDPTAEKGSNKIHQYIRGEKYKRIVLLEDFVGTGGQSFETVDWTIRNLGLSVLFCPMIIAPEGAAKYRELQASIAEEKKSNSDLPDFDFMPIFEMSSDCFVESNGETANRLFESIRELSENLYYQRFKETMHVREGPLGFWDQKSPQKGATVAMFSNTPNNSLPLLHHVSESWNPLFPRVARQPL